MPGRHLLLIKHSLPESIPGLDARDWQLSDEGRRCAALAERIAPYASSIIVTSQEPKARETGELVGRALGLPVESGSDLHEHDRRGVPWLDQDRFEAAVRSFFERPDDLVFGREIAHHAGSRFSRAIEAAVARHPTGTIAVVAHGTVISLYVFSNLLMNHRYLLRTTKHFVLSYDKPTGRGCHDRAHTVNPIPRRFTTDRRAAARQAS